MAILLCATVEKTARTFAAALDQTSPCFAHFSYTAWSFSSCSSRLLYRANLCPSSPARFFKIASTTSFATAPRQGFLVPLSTTARYLQK